LISKYPHIKKNDKQVTFFFFYYYYFWGWVKIVLVASLLNMLPDKYVIKLLSFYIDIQILYNDFWRIFVSSIKKRKRNQFLRLVLTIELIELTSRELGTLQVWRLSLSLCLSQVSLRRTWHQTLHCCETLLPCALETPGNFKLSYKYCHKQNNKQNCNPV
jgi:hypothetical protein